MDYKTDFLMGKYELGRFLGQGTFARVHYARSLKTGQSVAIKIIDKEKVSKVEFLKNQVKREISVMRKVRHPNIVNIYEVMATRTKIYFVIEYAKGGELFNKVAKGKLKEDVAQKYFQQLINAVGFCHSKGVYHRDIKPENLLLDGNDNLKVTDFGLSAVVESKRQDGLFHTACGTPAYVSPEVINQKGYDGVKSDIWSCGVVLFVLLAGYLPFHDKNLMDMYRKICKGEFKFPKGFSEDVRQLLSQILDPNPETRISIAKIRSSPWFRKDFNLKSPVTGSKGKSVALVNTDGNPGSSGSGDLDSAPREESIRPTKLDAFGIVFLLHRFDFTSSFEERDKWIEERFTSRQPASVIIYWLIDTAKCRRYKIKLTDKGLLNFKVTKAGKKGSVSIDVEIFEIAPEFHLVEITKSSGDTAEYQQIMKEDIRPALQDIVCDWQGKQQHQINENNKHSCTNSTSATGGTTSN